MIVTHRFAQFTTAERALVTTSAKSEHTCVHKVLLPPPWSTVLLRQQRMQRKTKTSHCCQFYYNLIAKHVNKYQKIRPLELFSEKIGKLSCFVHSHIILLVIKGAFLYCAKESHVVAYWVAKFECRKQVNPSCLTPINPPAACLVPA